jgi:predicted secreted Zn-dependent protease
MTKLEELKAARDAAAEAEADAWDAYYAELKKHKENSND